MTTLLYGFVPFGGPGGDLCLATEGALAELATEQDAWSMTAGATWQEIRESLSGPDDPLYPYVRRLLDSALMNAYEEFGDSHDWDDMRDDWWPPADRPEDSETPDVPPDGEIADDTQPTLGNFSDVELPKEIAAFATIGYGLNAEVTTYSPEDLPKILETAKRLGLEIRHDQAAFDKCRGDLRGW